MGKHKFRYIFVLPGFPNFSTRDSVTLNYTLSISQSPRQLTAERTRIIEIMESHPSITKYVLILTKKAISILMTDAEVILCWRQVWNVDDSFNKLIREFCHQHKVTLSPTSLQSLKIQFWPNQLIRHQFFYYYFRSKKVMFIEHIKVGCVFRWSSSLYCLMWNLD